MVAPLDRSHIRLNHRHEDAGAPAAGCRADPVVGHVLEAARTSLLVAVSPVGIMADFASRYGGERDAIALSILWSFVLSVLAIPILLALMFLETREGTNRLGHKHVGGCRVEALEMRRGEMASNAALSS